MNQRFIRVLTILAAASVSVGCVTTDGVAYHGGRHSSYPYAAYQPYAYPVPSYYSERVFLYPDDTAIWYAPVYPAPYVHYRYDPYWTGYLYRPAPRPPPVTEPPVQRRVPRAAAPNPPVLPPVDAPRRPPVKAEPRPPRRSAPGRDADASRQTAVKPERRQARDRVRR